MLMMSISYQLADTGGAAGSRDVGEKRSVADGHHGLGALESERAKPRAEAGGKDQRARHARPVCLKARPVRGSRGTRSAR